MGSENNDRTTKPFTQSFFWDDAVEGVFFWLFWIAIGVSIVGIIAVLAGQWEPFNGALGGVISLLRSANEDGAGLSGRNKSEIVRNLFFATAGYVGAIAGLYQLHNSAKRTRINAYQTGINDQQREIADKGERNDRFVKASELLKSESVAVQIAGIYALQRLGEEPQAGYREIVVQVLSGFVRTMTGHEVRAKRAIVRLKEISHFLGSDGGGASEESEERPSESVNAAIDALMTLTDPDRGGQNLGHLVDVRRCRLVGLDQPGRQMVRWRLDGADLSHSNIETSKLSGAFLVGTKLENALLSGVDMAGAYLLNANLTNARLTCANFKGADLGNTSLRHATLTGATVGNAKFRDSDLRWASLDSTEGFTAEQLAQALNVTWPIHVPRPKEGKYSEEWEAEQAAKDIDAP